MDRLCPCCESRSLRLAIDRDAIKRETRLRSEFARVRANGGPDASSLKDRVDLMHDEIVGLYECAECGVLVRGDVEADFEREYAEDAYDGEVLEHFLERDIHFFSLRESNYRPLLPETARVVEVGSYAGGFLRVAEQWGWEATGLDIGRDVVRFSKRVGLDARRATLEESGFGDGSLDGVFIWNCFDQLPEPHVTLGEARRVLRSGGVLVLRTPNVLFYRVAHVLLHSAGAANSADGVLFQVMAHNNLLGFPYQYGYAPSHLSRMVERHGFRTERILPSHVVVHPRAEAPSWVMEEQEATRALLDRVGAAVSTLGFSAEVSPWVEVVARR
jgi:SAM-dependent methyltransferase